MVERVEKSDGSVTEQQVRDLRGKIYAEMMGLQNEADVGQVSGEPTEKQIRLEELNIAMKWNANALSGFTRKGVA